MNKISANDRSHLMCLIDSHISEYGPDCDLNHIDVSNVEDMAYVFCSKHFRGDISKWDVSNVTTMNSMFEDCSFNGDISLWNTSNVKSMKAMFFQSCFNGDISQWDTSNVEDMAYMFQRSHFNGDISKWNTSRVIRLYCMFIESVFEGDLSEWNININTNFSTFVNEHFKGILPSILLDSLDECFNIKVVEALLKNHEYPLSDVHVKRCLSLKKKPSYVSSENFRQIKELQKICDGLAFNKDDSVKYIMTHLKNKNNSIGDLNYDFQGIL